MNHELPALNLPRRRCLVALGLPLLALAGCEVAGAAGAVDRPGTAYVLPDPRTDLAAGAGGTQTAIFGGGCFWGVQAVFQRVKGVASATSGYAGGPPLLADYRSVSTGSTGHAEVVQVLFDPRQVTFGQLMKVFMSVAHNPTQLNYQGPDIGTQYRSAIFTTDDEQARVAKAYVEQLQAAKVYPERIVTQITPLVAGGFHRAEDYHQDYLDRHPTQPYIVMHDMPKLVALEKTFPTLFKPRKTG